MNGLSGLSGWSLSPALDLFPLSAGVLAAIACGLLGNFLVLRRQSLMGDAISHSVLPGLVGAFLVFGSRGAGAMFLGAAASGVATVVLVGLVKRYGRVEPGAAMGVVFSVLFALGVLMIEGAGARQLDLDAECVLHGQLETLVWSGAPERFAGVRPGVLLDAVPRQVWTLLGMAGLSGGFVVLLFKELRIAAFDPGLATSQGYHAGALHAALMLLVAGATVASFEAVGSILVIAMLICPAATARLVTDRLRTQLLVSVVAAAGAAVIGYLSASMIPALFERDAVNAAGSMATASGVLLVVAVLGSPSHGVIARRVRARRLTRTIALDDLLGVLYRARESGTRAPDGPGWVVALGVRRGLIDVRGARPGLTASGLAHARELVRGHRLWEAYLVDRAGMPPDHVHRAAEVLEHLGVRPDTGPASDPHGRAIP